MRRARARARARRRGSAGRARRSGRRALGRQRALHRGALAHVGERGRARLCTATLGAHAPAEGCRSRRPSGDLRGAARRPSRGARTTCAAPPLRAGASQSPRCRCSRWKRRRCARRALSRGLVAGPTRDPSLGPSYAYRHASSRRGICEPGAQRSERNCTCGSPTGWQGSMRRPSLDAEVVARHTLPRSRRHLGSCGSSTGGPIARSAPPRPTGSSARRASRARSRRGRRRRRWQHGRSSCTPDDARFERARRLLAHGETPRARPESTPRYTAPRGGGELRALNAEGELVPASWSGPPAGRSGACCTSRPSSTLRPSWRTNSSPSSVSRPSRRRAVDRPARARRAQRAGRLRGGAA